VSKSIDELKAELSSLESKEQNIATAHDPGDVSDDDPAIEACIITPDSEIGRQFPFLVRNREQAKAAIVRQRRLQRLYAVIVNESAPMPERIAAAAVVKAQLAPWHFTDRYSPDELVRRVRPRTDSRLEYNREADRYERRPLADPPQEPLDVWCV